MVRWNEEKNRQLQERRGVSFDRIAELYEREEFEAVVKHEIRPNQQILIMHIDGYTWAVPVVIEADGQIVFKDRLSESEASRTQEAIRLTSLRVKPGKY